MIHRAAVLGGGGGGGGGGWGAISLIPLHHFHALHRDLDVSRGINAVRSALHIASRWDSNREPLVSKRNSLTSELRALMLFTIG